MTALPPPRSIELAPIKEADGSFEPPISLSVHEGGQGPAIVLLHGFPELAFSWRKQFQPLVDAGFRTIVPDQRGYGASDAPRGSQHYDMTHLTGDLVHLLDALEIEKAIFAGHDWGGFVAWAMPVLHPDRTAGVIGINTPYLPRSPIPPTQALSFAAGGDKDKIYILWFQEPGVAEGVLDQNPRLVFEKLMRGSIPMEEMQAQIAESGGDMNPFLRLAELPVRGDALLSEEELEVYTQAFAQSGFHGGISWYRNFDRNWEQHPEFGVQKISHPSLMITAENDMALQPALAADMPNRCEDLETIMISQCGHWTQQEKPEELNQLMIDWLTKRFG